MKNNTKNVTLENQIDNSTELKILEKKDLTSSNTEKSTFDSFLVDTNKTENIAKEDRNAEQTEKTGEKLTKKQEFINFLIFTLFSISAGIIQFVTFTLLFEVAKLWYWPCYLFALILSVIYNFTVNRKFTFKSATNIPIAMLKVLGYYVVFTPLSTWWGDALTKCGWNEYVILLGTMVINMITEFLFCRYFVYNNSINTKINKKSYSKK